MVEVSVCAVHRRCGRLCAHAETSFCLQFLDQVDMPVTVHRQVRSLPGMSSTPMSWRRCRFRWCVLPLRFSSCSTLIRWSSSVVGDSRQLQPVSSWTRSLICPLCSTTGWVSKCRKLRAFSTFDKVVDAPVGAVHRQVVDVL